MTGMETLIIDLSKDVASSFILSLGKRFYKRITKSKSKKYVQELSKTIVLTIKEYDNQFPIEETDKIPFYKSEALFNELLKFRFTNKLNQETIKKIIENDSKILAPTEAELFKFFEIFDEQITLNETLKLLNIKTNYKDEIFQLSEVLKSVRSELKNAVDEIKSEIRKSNVSVILEEEWNAQLNQIFEDIKQFKAFTAKNHLENLERRFVDHSLQNPRLLVRLYNLKSSCLDQIGSFEIQTEHAQLLIQIYKLQSNNLNYKSNAAHAYYSLNDIGNALKLSEEVIQQNEFNTIAWNVKCFAAGGKFQEILSIVPPLVKSQNLFKINLYYFIFHHHHVNSISQLKELGLWLDLDYEKEPKFSYMNMKYQLLVASYLLAKFFEEHPSFSIELINKDAQENADFKYAYKILKLSYENLTDTEIEKSYLYYQFQYHYCSYILNNDSKAISNMQAVYERLEVKSIDVYVHMMQAYNTLKGKDNYVKAIEIGESYDGPFDQTLCIILANNYAIAGEKQKQTTCFIKYIEGKKKIDTMFFLNFLSFIRFQNVLVTEELKTAVDQVLNQKEVTQPEYIYLLKLFCFIHLQIGNYTSNELQEFIENAKATVNIADTKVSVQIAYAYAYTNQEEKAKNFLRQFVNKTTPSESLLLYCKILYNTNGDKIELLNILKNWREKFVPEYELLQIEFSLRELQNNWTESIKIAKKALELFPDSEFFINGLFVSLNNSVSLEEIRKYYSLVKGRTFKNESVALNISQALLRGGLFEESLELLYQHAVKKENIQCRRGFIPLAIRYPENLFKNYEVVLTDCYVKYEIGNNQNVIHITEENKDDYPNKLFLDKKVNDVFSIQQNFSEILAEVKILHISNKYGALLQDLFKEAENPISGHLVQSFKFEGDDIEAIEKTFIKNFGVKGSLQKQHIEKQLQQYYEGSISFAEITNSVFNRKFVDAYFNLTNEYGKPFKAISPSINNIAPPEKENFYVLDFTSLCLFYQLTQECSFEFSTKFYISHLIRQETVNNLEEAKTNPESNLSLSITAEKVTPHFYDDGFNARRINTFQTLLNWIDNNCIVMEVPERLNIIAGPQTKLNQLDLYFNILIDCRLMVDKQDYILLTNDVFYYRQFKAGTNNVVSPLCYLEKFQTEKTDTYIDFILRHNYVGIPITSAILNDQFYKMLSDGKNWFSICLENLRYAWNPNRKHITEAVKFIKSLHISSFVSDNVKEQTILAIFQNLIVGMDSKLLQLIIRIIEIEFRLLDIQRINVLQLLSIALKRR